MSRKDFNLIAATIATLPKDMRKQVASAFVKSLSQTNPNFKPLRFMIACEGE